MFKKLGENQQGLVENLHAGVLHLYIPEHIRPKYNPNSSDE
jgi:hypothetical protein